MSKPDSFSAALTLAMADHELIATCLESARAILAQGHLDDLMQEAESLQSFIGKKLTQHFQMEETLLFPFLLERCDDDRTRELVVSLTVEHGAIADKARELRETAARVASAGDFADLLKVLLRDFLDALQAHAEKEDALLLSVLEKERQRLAATVS